MILRPYQRRGHGEAKAAPLKKMFELTADGSLSNDAGSLLAVEVEALARVEVIWTTTNRSHVSMDDNDGRGNPLRGKPWGLVAIWTNPNTTAGQAVEAYWCMNFTLRETICARPFGTLLNRHGLITLPWPTKDLRGFDFCLCTPTRLNVTNWSYKLAAGAINRGEYFDRTSAAGIVTGDDFKLCKIRASETTSADKKLSANEHL